MNEAQIYATFPRGTVTFLFTDIAGSTKLLQRLGDDYTKVLDDQRIILRGRFEKWNGREVDTQGDSFFVAFQSASDAVSASVEIQQKLKEHSWPKNEEIKVRIGMHTGEAEKQDEGYVGIDVHRASRICSAAHGSQVLLSQTTHDLIAQKNIEGVSLRDLDEHVLKDLSFPEHIYQLVIAGFPVEFPAIKSLNAFPNNLPGHLTNFIGRKNEKEELKKLLQKSRLVTLVGPGGAGKTRLSVQVAADLIEEYKDGVWFIDLGAVASTDLIVPKMAGIFNFSVDTLASSIDPKNQLLDYLRMKSMLLVMDNFEHLVEGAELLVELLNRASGIRLLVTSRERLNLQGEWIYDLKGMSYPQNGDDSRIEDYSALRVFVMRAQQINFGFNLSDEDTRYVVKICQQVSGMPLGIELAAAWVSMLSCKEIAEEIDENLDFLAASKRDIPEKHRSLRAVFDQSWRLLSEQQRDGLQKLSIFQGGFSRDAALRIAGVDLTMLYDFVNKSLLLRSKHDRYEMHKLLKQFSEEKLDSHPQEKNSVSDKHSQYYMRYLSEDVNLLQRIRAENLDELRVEFGNIRSASYWVVIHRDEMEARKALGSLNIFFGNHGFHEGLDFFRAISDFLMENGGGIEPGADLRVVLLCARAYQTYFSSNLGTPTKESIYQECLPYLRELNLNKELSICLLSKGIDAIYRGDNNESIGYIKESIKLQDGSKKDMQFVASLIWLGWAYYELGDFDRAGKYFSESYQLSKSIGNRLGMAYSLSKLGTWSDSRQEYSQAMGYHQEALECFVEFDDKAGQGYAVSRMSLSAWGMGDYSKARQYGIEGYEHFEEVGHRWGISTSLSRIGFAELGLGILALANDHFHEGLERSMEFKIKGSAIYALIGIAILWSMKDETKRAVELFEYALNHPMTPALYKDIIQRYLPNLAANLLEDELRVARERWKGMDLEDVIEAQLRDKGEQNTSL